MDGPTASAMLPVRRATVKTDLLALVLSACSI